MKPVTDLVYFLKMSGGKYSHLFLLIKDNLFASVGVRKGEKKNFQTVLKCLGKSTFESGLYPLEHLLAAIAHAQVDTTQTQLYFILGI